MLDLYVFNETRRLEMATLERRLLRRAELVERNRNDENGARQTRAGRTVGLMSFDPRTLETMARMDHDDRQAEAARDRLVRKAQAGRPSARVVVARALRALASRLDGGIGASPEANRRLAGA